MTNGESHDRAAWTRVNDLFHRALEQPGAQREAFVKAESSGDEELAREVLSLLSAHDRASDFIEQPATGAPDPGTPAATPRAIDIGHYRIVDVVGEGGMGIVYLAEDRRLGRTVALKAVAPQSAGDTMRRERLRREARAAATLNHPGIATIYALEEIDTHLYLSVEYVPGETLREELRRGPLAPAIAVRTMAEVARAVAAAHAAGIVHRDLKPENVIRTAGGAVKILDFGLAHFHDMPASLAGLTADGAAIGTPGYMSPEQIRGTTIDARTDIFAMGVMLHELLTGQAPFAAGDAAATIARVLERDPPGIGTIPGLDATLTRGLETLIALCLAKAPDARLRSASGLADALDALAPAFQTGTPIPSPLTALPPISSLMPPGPSSQAVSWWKFHQVATSIAYVLLLWPLWHARNAAAGPYGTLLFLAGLTAVVVSVSLRLHLLFAARYYDAAWHEDRVRSARSILGADVAFVLILLIEGLLVQSVDPRAASLLVASASAVAVSFVVIEPATTRVAFGGVRGRTPFGGR